MENGALGGSYNCSFAYDGFTFTITQCVTRTITIYSSSQTTALTLIDAYQTIQKLLMLFDGRFYSLETFEIIGEKELSEQYTDRQLNYYKSADFTQNPASKLIEFNSVITSQLYDNWVKLLDEADILHQIYLYMMSEGVLVNDLRIAFLIETAESMVELIKAHTFCFTSLTPGNGTLLKMCVDGLVTTYGKEIFDKELKNDYGNFLQKSINSRIRIMHIKNNFKKDIFTSNEYILYLAKYSLLYRRIMFELLGIPYSAYSDNLKSSVKAWEEWYDHL